MNKNSSPLAAVHRVRHVGAVVVVHITDRKNTLDVGPHARLVDLDLVASHNRQAHLPWQLGPLHGREVREERVAHDGLALREVHAEDIEFLVLFGILDLPAVLEALDGRDRAVVDLHVVRLKLRLPVRVLLLEGGFLRGRLRSVDEDPDVCVERHHLEDRTHDVGKIADDAERLVAVLEAVAPGTPENTVTPGVLQAWGARKEVLHAGGHDHLAGGERLAIAVRRAEVVLDPLDGDHLAISDSGGVVLGDLLAGQRTEGLGDGA